MLHERRLSPPIFGSYKRVGAVGLCALLATIASFAMLVSSASARVQNDDFERAQDLAQEVPVKAEASNAEATTELEEPADPDGAGHTIWFEWHGPANQVFTFSTCESNFPTRLDLYEAPTERSLSNLTPVSTTEGPDHLGQECEFRVNPAYSLIYIRVDGRTQDVAGQASSGEGAVKFTITPVTQANDDFADAQPLKFHRIQPEGRSPDYEVIEEGGDFGASTEPEEPMDAVWSSGSPPIAGGASAWYKLTPPADWNPYQSSPNAAVRNFSGAADALYTGDSLAELEPVEVLGAFGEYKLVPATTYWLQLYAPRDPKTGVLKESGFEFKVELTSPGGYEEERVSDANAALASEPSLPTPAVSQGPPTPIETPPQTSMEAKSIDPTGAVATFRFSSQSASGFRCRLDSTSWKSCHSPKTYRDLTDGRHIFRVAAVASDGQSDASPAVVHFKVAKGRQAHPHRHR